MNLKAFFIGATAAVASLTNLNSQTLFVPGADGNTAGINKSLSGNVGIGINNPLYPLHLYSPNNHTYLCLNKVNDSYEAGINFFRASDVLFYIYSDDGSNSLKIQSSKETDDKPRIQFPFPTLDIYMAQSGGNVGIGTSSPQNKLDVNGTIHAREVKVDLNGWSDFVFQPTYKLKPLIEVEKYIKVNGHLEDIPSAKEVEKNGVNMGEMQAKLLQKIEELTLYVIELKKENEELKKEKDLQLAEQKETLDMVIEEIKSLKAKMNQ